MAAKPEHIDLSKVPSHIAIIMDGNGRWAKKKGAMRIFGHRNAIKAIRATTEACGEIGVSYLTLYAFSTENWSRPKEEVDGLMELLVDTLKNEIGQLMENGIRLMTIGNTSHLPPSCQNNLKWAIDHTKENKGLKLVLALSYSGRSEIVEAVRAIGQKVKTGDLAPEQINDSIFRNYLQTSDIPDPELLIRTSGEMRISNFLLWQIAYTELFVTETLWPDFRKENLFDAIRAYQKRERRFGKTSEQLNSIAE